VTAYTPEAVEEWEDSASAGLPAIVESHSVTWIDVQGLGDETVLRDIARTFRLHDLALEDVVNTPQRPKVESYDDYLFLIARTARPESADHFEAEQLGLFLGPGYVLTFQDRYGDVLDPIRRRIRAGKGRSGTRGPTTSPMPCSTPSSTTTFRCSSRWVRC
jgi:magnesium transporter